MNTQRTVGEAKNDFDILSNIFNQNRKQEENKKLMTTETFAF